MLAPDAYLDPFHRLADDAVAFVESELDLPASVTLEALDGLLVHRTIKLEDLIAFVTGLPQNRDEVADRDVEAVTVYENGLRRWHAAVWLFKKAAEHRKSVAEGTRDNVSVERIKSSEFAVIPSCLGFEDNSIATDMARQSDGDFREQLETALSETMKRPLARWRNVAFDTKWLVKMLRPFVSDSELAVVGNEQGNGSSKTLNGASPSARNVMDKRASVSTTAEAIVAFRKAWPRGIKLPKEAEVRKILTDKIGSRVTKAVQQEALKEVYGPRGRGRPPNE